MEENFNLLFDRVIDSLNKTDLLYIKNQLDNIKGNTIIVGVGGSSVVSNFFKKVLVPNGIVECKGSRDLNYEDISLYDNIVVVSYSGTGYVIENVLEKGKKVYLLTNGDVSYDDVEIIKYDSSIKKEHSFISLASTLVPMTILLHYYNPVRIGSLIDEIYDMKTKILLDIENGNLSIKNNKVYEIIGGCEYSSAISYLESTLVESGIALPIVHEKFSYCHGRSTTCYKNNNGLIYFDSNTELDKIMLENLKNYYTEIIKIEKYYNSSIVNTGVFNDYYATLKSMFLTRLLALNKEVDLSRVDYNPIVKKLYYFKGEM